MTILVAVDTVRAAQCLVDLTEFLSVCMGCVREESKMTPSVSSH